MTLPTKTSPLRIREEEDRMKQEVLEHRKERKVGARPTNKSAAQDYRAQLVQMNKEARF